MSNAVRQMCQTLGRDKRKLSMAVALVAVGLLLWGRLLLKDVPRVAVADPPARQARAAPAAGTAGATAPRRVAVSLPLPPTPTRDLFVLDRSHYQTRPTTVVEAPRPKSPPARVDVTAEEAARRAGLVLQSTVLGEQPRATISGQDLSPGQSIKDFVVRQVRHGSVVLEYAGQVFELKL